jgi:hypothetical protein
MNWPARLKLAQRRYNLITHRKCDPMDVICPLDSHSNGLQRLSSLPAATPAILMQQLSLRPPPEPPARMAIGCAAIFQLLLWASLSYYLLTRLMENRSMGMLVLFSGILVVALTSQIIIYRRKRAREKAAFEEYARQSADWKAARTAWERLYYCPRHDIIFDPEHSAGYCDSSSLVDFLESQTKSSPGGR